MKLYRKGERLMPEWLGPIIQFMVAGIVIGIFTHMKRQTEKKEERERHREQDETNIRQDLEISYLEAIEELGRKIEQMQEKISRLVENMDIPSNKDTPKEKKTVKEEKYSKNKNDNIQIPYENGIPDFLKNTDGKYYSRVPLAKRKYLQRLHQIIVKLEPNAEFNVSSQYMAYFISVPKGKRINPLVTVRHTLQSYFFPKGTGGSTLDRSLEKYDTEKKILSFGDNFFEEFESRLQLARKEIQMEYGI